jgi:hypothetical protein
MQAPDLERRRGAEIEMSAQDEGPLTRPANDTLIGCTDVGCAVMPLTEKVLWIVNMNTDAAETAFSKHALATGATTVCIRTSSTRFPDTIKRFHDLGIKVYAWRWPPATKAGALKEANDVAQNLIKAGLDGYIVDPESDKAGATNDWNQAGLGPLAAQFCSTIKGAAPASFVSGTTSGCSYPAAGMKPKIPWKEFFAASDVLLPQTYWRWTNASGKKQKINGGTPAAAIAKGVPAWKVLSQGKPIVPMAGEVDVVTNDEIADYGTALAKMNVTEGHFYTDNGKIPVLNLAAIKAL